MVGSWGGSGAQWTLGWVCVQFHESSTYRGYKVLFHDISISTPDSRAAQLLFFSIFFRPLTCNTALIQTQVCVHCNDRPLPPL